MLSRKVYRVHVRDRSMRPPLHSDRMDPLRRDTGCHMDLVGGFRFGGGEGNDGDGRAGAVD
jgi:hypothetical protein